jgi:hypothetical protein
LSFSCFHDLAIAAQHVIHSSHSRRLNEYAAGCAAEF